MSDFPKQKGRGGLLKRHRTNSGRTGVETAKAIGVSENHLRQVEVGQRDLSREKLEEAAAFLNVRDEDHDQLFHAFGLFPPDVHAFLVTRPKAVVKLIRQVLERQANG